MPLASLEHLNLEYASTGDESRSAIVLIRGLGTQMIEWPVELLDALLAANLRVITFDNRDVGLSSKMAEAYTLKDMADDVIGLMDCLQVKQAHIFGISLGGMVAQLLAYHYPERLMCLFSVMSSSGNPDLPGMSKEMRDRMVESAGTREEVVRTNTSNRALFGSPGYPETDAFRHAQAERAYDRCYCPEGQQRQMQAAIADGSRVERLNQIHVPTLVIHGAEDPLVPPAAGEDTARQMPCARLEMIPGMGHNIPAELGQTLANHVKQFIQDHTA